MIKTLALIFVLISTSLAVSSQSQQYPQPGIPNFQGSFDSTQPFQTENIAQTQQSSQEYTFEQEQQDILQFSEVLGDFIPDQTFTLRLSPFSKYTFFLWPGAQVESIRGMFHCEISLSVEEQYDVGQYLDLTIMDQSSIMREYKHQRLGVFSQPHNLKDHRYYFYFSSHEAPIDIYFSYQKITANKKKPNTQTNSTELTKVSNSFKKVNRLLQQQEREMIRLIQIGDRHTLRIKKQLKQLYWRGLGQGLVLIASAAVSLWMLKRQIYSQYQSLV